MNDTDIKTADQDQSKEIQFFDEFTKGQEYDVLGDHGYRVIIDAMKSLIGPRTAAGCKIIDLGCGTGSFTRRMAEGIEAQVMGVDISPNSIDVAKGKNDGCTYQVGDITQLDFADETFDVIMFSGVLHHFGDFQNCLKEGYRILKNGGCMVSFDPHIKNPAMWLYRHPSSPLFSSIGKTENEQLLSGEQVGNALEKEGFLNIHTHAVSGVTFKYVESSRARFMLPVYNSMEYLLGLTPLARSIGSFLICYAEK